MKNDYALLAEIYEENWKRNLAAGAIAGSLMAAAPYAANMYHNKPKNTHFVDYSQQQPEQDTTKQEEDQSFIGNVISNLKYNAAHMQRDYRGINEIEQLIDSINKIPQANKDKINTLYKAGKINSKQAKEQLFAYAKKFKEPLKSTEKLDMSKMF